MRILFFALLCLGLLTSCNAVEDANPLKALSEKSTGDDSLSNATTTEYMELVNKYRVSLGLNTLLLEEDMSKLAIAHSQNMAIGAIAFGHTGFAERCNKSREIMGNGNLCGEIVAQGQSTPVSVFQSWLGSSGHRAKLQEPRYTHTGFGFFKSEKGVMYWTQIFLEID
jgi:uncharacterized protein YkwD